MSEKVKEPKLIMTREKEFIYFFNTRMNKSVRYNLKLKCMQKENTSRHHYDNWVSVETQYDFFRGFTLKDIETKDIKFKNMLIQSVLANHTCTSLSSFVSRLNNVLVYENYITQEVKYIVRVNYNFYGTKHMNHFKHPLEDYDKNTIKFFKDNDYEVTNNFEDFYFKDKIICGDIINRINNINLSKIEKINIIDNIINNNYFFTLINDFNYNVESLINYVVNYLKPFENLSYDSSFSLLKDYYQMAKTIGRNVKKYPKYLKSMHDIITANYNCYKKEYDEELFKRLVKKELIFEDKNFCTVIPLNSKDIISEGTDLNHCVSSYVDKVLNRETYIFFLRLKKSKEISLVTLELINNEIINAKGSCNRGISDEEKCFLEKFCKVKRIKLKI